MSACNPGRNGGEHHIIFVAIGHRECYDNSDLVLRRKGQPLSTADHLEIPLVGSGIKWVTCVY
jgi:hypothetical protein